jgi:hypothetical protein
MTTQVAGHLPSTLAMGQAMGLPMPMLVDGTPRWSSVRDLARWEDLRLLRVASKDTWSRRDGMTVATAYLGRDMERIRVEWVSAR